MLKVGKTIKILLAFSEEKSEKIAKIIKKFILIPTLSMKRKRLRIFLYFYFDEREKMRECCYVI